MAWNPPLLGRRSSAIQQFWDSHKARTMGGRSLAPERVLAEGPPDPEKLESGLGSRVLFLCPNISAVY